MVLLRSRRVAMAGLFGIVAVGAAACSDPNQLHAAYYVFTDTVAVYAMTGTPPSYPAGINTSTAQAVRTDGNFSFDIAFDLDSLGRVDIYPVKLVASTFGSSRAVGVQKLTIPFDSLTKAPGTLYTYDSVTVVSPGDAVVVQATTSYCSLQLTSLLYSKFIIDSVDLASRQVYLRTTVDPNCGFRSFRAGVPKN